MLAVIQACPCKREAITLLQLLVWSDRPLEMTELIDALTVRPEETPAFKEEDRLFDPMDIVEYCSSLVVVVAKDERASVRLAHSSVKEYLTSRSVGVPLHETFSETTARAYIVRLCVAYMSSLDYARLELRELVGKYPFAEYAGSSWPEHARMVATMDGSLIRLIQEFLWNKDAISACLRYHSSSQNHSLRSTVKQSDALHYAAFFGLEAVSEQLLNEGANPNLRIDGRLMTPLQAAAFEGHHNVVQMLLDNGADPNVSDGIRGNALAAAVQYGHFETARILLERGSHVNAQSCGRGSALHVAAYLGHCKLVQLLLDFGSDVNARAHTVLVPADDDNDFPPARVLRKSGCYETIVQTEYRQQRTFTNYHLLPAEAYGDGSPLLAAILYNHQAAIRILVERGADVNFRSDICGTPLGAAAAEGQQSTIEFLLDRGADINTQDRFGTALHIAVATGGDERIIGTLLDRGADVRATGGRYGTVLQAAVITRNRPALRLLLERGADIQATVNPHGTALQAAAFVGNRSALKLMLDRGADVDAREGEYGSALQAAAARGYRSIVKLLLKQGASVDACETPAWTALHAAIDNDKATVVDILLKHGASLELRGKFGTALQVASNGATLRIVRTLLDCGADVNASPAYHGTALIVAASRGDRRITRLLLQHGAEVDQKVMLGPSALHKQSCFHQTPCTALWIAMVRGHKRVAGMLLNAGAPWPSDDELGMLHKEHLLFEYSRGTQTVEESQCHSFDRLTYLAEIEDDDGEEEEGVEYPDDLDDDTDHEEDTDND